MKHYPFLKIYAWYWNRRTIKYEPKEATEIVYLLQNPAMPKYYKIGRTTKPIEQRLKDLDNTSAPLPFEVVFLFKTTHSSYLEALLHREFYTKRVRNSREFFKLSRKDIKRLIWLANKHRYYLVQ